MTTITSKNNNNLHESSNPRSDPEMTTTGMTLPILTEQWDTLEVTMGPSHTEEWPPFTTFRSGPETNVVVESFTPLPTRNDCCTPPSSSDETSPLLSGSRGDRDGLWWKNPQRISTAPILDHLYLEIRKKPETITPTPTPISKETTNGPHHVTNRFSKDLMM